MGRPPPVLLALVLLAAPAALAHDPMGTPKNYCEPRGEWNVHDYLPPATGRSVGPSLDGNLGGDCNPDDLFSNSDGHAEHATGGARILVHSGTGAASGDPNVGAGSLYCYEEEGHHPEQGPVHVDDLNGLPTSFLVYADSVDWTYAGEGCGDFLADDAITCAGACLVPFPPGLDGAYLVAVEAMDGHIQGGHGHVVW